LVVESGDPDARTALVLHGGGGPQTVAPIAGHLTATMHVLARPTRDGTARAGPTTSHPSPAKPVST
jgi:hypothetical protein